MLIPDNIYETLGMEKPKEKEEIVPHKAVKDYDLLKQGTKENPIFLVVTESPGEYKDSIECIKDTLVACTGIKDITFEENKYYTYTKECASLRCLNSQFKYEGRTIRLDRLKISEIKETTPELLKLYNEVLNSIHIKITTKIYPEVDIIDNDIDPYEYRSIPYIEQSYIPNGIHTIDEAEEWILKNHPEEYLSMCAKNNIGDFLIGAIPQAYGEEKEWMTREGREKITKQFAKVNGFEVSDFDYDKSDSLLKENEDWIKEKLKELKLTPIGILEDDYEYEL